MLQYSLVVSWQRKEVSPTVILQRLKDLFGDLAISYPTVTRTIRKLSWSTNEEKSNSEVGRPADFHNIKIIQDTIDENPMISCHEISRQTLIPYTTVRYTLLYHLKYKCRRLHWIPHSLTESQKSIRVEYCKQIISILQKQQKLNWRYIITGDESWFFYHTPNGFQKMKMLKKKLSQIFKLKRLWLQFSGILMVLRF